MNRLRDLYHNSLIKGKLPLRTLQYIEVLRFASKLTGLNLLNGRGKKALDVGCGSGKGLLALKLLGYDAYGFDVNQYLISETRLIVRDKSKVIQYDVESGIPFDESFDLITCFSVLEHLRNPEKALANVLANKPNVLVIDVPNRHTEFLRLVYLLLKRERIPINIFSGNGFLLKDKDHVNVKKPVEWYHMIYNLLNKQKAIMQLKCFVNYFMFSFGKRIFTMRLPFLGSSTLFVVVKELTKDHANSRTHHNL
jgi:SAM-dependent methyltransferase